MSEIAISLENVSKPYKLYESPRDRLKEALHPMGKSYHKDFYVLKNINLEVKKGELLGIVGKNGFFFESSNFYLHRFLAVYQVLRGGRRCPRCYRLFQWLLLQYQQF